MIVRRRGKNAKDINRQSTRIVTRVLGYGWKMRYAKKTLLWERAGEKGKRLGESGSAQGEIACDGEKENSPLGQCKRKPRFVIESCHRPSSGTRTIIRFIPYYATMITERAAKSKEKCWAGCVSACTKSSYGWCGGEYFWVVVRRGCAVQGLKSRGRPVEGTVLICHWAGGLGGFLNDCKMAWFAGAEVVFYRRRGTGFG